MLVNIFLTDASFDHKTKTSIIGVYEVISKQKFQYVYKDAKNSTEAEIYGLRKAIEVAGNADKIDNVIFICDNKSAVNTLKKEFFQKEELRTKFWYAQFIWLPREYTWIVDFLSKNINEELAKELKEIKTSNTERLIESKESKMFEHNVNSIQVDKNVFSQALYEKRKNQFLMLSKDFKFNSSFFNSLENLSITELSEFIFDEIAEIENDLDFMKKEDILIYYSGKSLFDLIISL